MEKIFLGLFLFSFNPNPINPLWIKAKSWMWTKTQLQGCNPVKWVESNSVNLWNLQIGWNCHCNWKLNNFKDDCFIQQSVIPMVKVFLLNCSPPSEVGLKPYPPLLLFRQWLYMKNFLGLELPSLINIS